MERVMSELLNTPGALNILPDCRVQNNPRTVFLGALGYWQHVYCGMCHKEGPAVPKENMTFAFWLCNECFSTQGEITNTYVMPDEVFFERVRQEQLASYGRYLSAEEFVAVVEEGTTPLAKLLKERK